MNENAHFDIDKIEIHTSQSSTFDLKVFSENFAVSREMLGILRERKLILDKPKVQNQLESNQELSLLRIKLSEKQSIAQQIDTIHRSLTLLKRKLEKNEPQSSEERIKRLELLLEIEKELHDFGGENDKNKKIMPRILSRNTSKQSLMNFETIRNASKDKSKQSLKAQTSSNQIKNNFQKLENKVLKNMKQKNAIFSQNRLLKNRAEFNEYYGKEESKPVSKSGTNTSRSRNVSDSRDDFIKSVKLKSQKTVNSIQSFEFPAHLPGRMTECLRRKDIEVQRKTESLEKSLSKNKLTQFLEKMENKRFQNKNFPMKGTFDCNRQIPITKNSQKKTSEKLHFVNICPVKSTKIPSVKENKKFEKTHNLNFLDANKKFNFQELKVRFGTIAKGSRNKNEAKSKQNNSDSTKKKIVGDQNDLLIDKELEEIDMLIFQAKLVKF